MPRHPSSVTDEDRVAELLCIYADHPLDDGDGVLVIDDEVCLEIERLADEWAVLRSSTVTVLRASASRARVLIARPEATLHDSDFQLWRDLHADLRDSSVQLLPVRALPATA